MKTILISTLASLASSSSTIQGYLQLRLADQYDQNYGQFKLDLCAINFKHEPAVSDCKYAPNDGLKLIDQIGMVAQSSVTKRSRQVDFGFGFSWPVSTLKSFNDVTILSLPILLIIRLDAHTQLFYID